MLETVHRQRWLSSCSILLMSTNAVMVAKAETKFIRLLFTGEPMIWIKSVKATESPHWKDVSVRLVVYCTRLVEHANDILLKGRIKEEIYKKF